MADLHNKTQVLLTPESDLLAFADTGGGKARNMAKLSQLGLPVPSWFCVSTEAFDTYVHVHGLKEQLTPSPEADLDREEQRICALFTSHPIPEALMDTIWQQVVACGLAESFVAVRSSGLDEDSADHSFAGQFSSFLFQKGRAQIDESLRRCWASGFSARALAYRRQRGLPLDNIRVGVVIQEMIDADAAGVAFSRHPIRVLDRDTLLISSVFGLGEGLVSGELDADHFEVIRKQDATASDIIKHVVTKESVVRQHPNGGVTTLSLAAELQKQASLSDSQILAISQLVLNLEEKFGCPQDCEWVLRNDELFLVQTRPITNLPNDAFFEPSINGSNVILWDNSNIIESYSGVTSPLTFSFASEAYRQVYVQFCALMGVPQRIVEENEHVFRNMLGLIRGRIYYNLINWYQLVLMLPGASTNSGFMETMMGVKDQVRPEQKEIFNAVSNPPRYSPLKRIILLALTLYRYLRINRIIADFQSQFRRVYEGARRVDFKSIPLAEQVKYYHYLEDELLKKWHAPIINDYLCMVFFGLLKKLTEKWVSRAADNASLQNDLLCGQGDLDSTEPTRFLMRMAREIDSGDSEFRRWFMESEAESVWQSLVTTKKTHPIAVLFSEFLDKYGFRCVNELKLEENDLHDDPTFVVHSVQSYLRTKSYDIEAMEKREREIRDKAEATIRNMLSGWKRWVYLFVLSQARKAVRNRENLRFCRTKVFGVTRHLFRGIGHNLRALGLLDTEKDVFFLTVDEIISFVEGRCLTSNLRGLVAIRSAEFGDYTETIDPPERFTTQGAVGAAMNHTSVLAEADLLRRKLDDLPPNMLAGTPCCPGVVEGTVRVVLSLEDARNINGEILVTGRTDPGWVPLYPSCSGLLIERGSLLSHSAVVARELGLPTIVGISGGLLKRLKSGMRVRVDAGKGEITILEEQGHEK